VLGVALVAGRVVDEARLAEFDRLRPAHLGEVQQAHDRDADHVVPRRG
jgi:hypothetical protein